MMENGSIRSDRYRYDGRSFMVIIIIKIITSYQFDLQWWHLNYIFYIDLLYSLSLSLSTKFSFFAAKCEDTMFKLGLITKINPIKKKSSN